MTLSTVPAATTKKIINLELSQKLQDLGKVTDFSFEADTTQNFILELKIDNNNIRIICHYYKDWNRTRRNAKDALIEKEIPESYHKLIIDTLDANYHTITASQHDYNSDDDQEQIQKENSRESKE